MSTSDRDTECHMRRETVRMPGELRGGMEQLLDEDVFVSKSELIRTAVRGLLEDHDALPERREGPR